MAGRSAIFIIGAGIVGLCAASYLRRAGIAVTIIDPLGPGNGASFGNGGMLSVDAYAPMALPGMIRNVPAWLLKRDGPLVVRPGYAAKVAPWLMRWVRAGSFRRAAASARALNALHRPCHDLYRDLLGAPGFDSLVRVAGSLQVWESSMPGRSEAVRARLRTRLDVDVRPVTGGECRDLVPGLAPTVTRGLHFPRNGHTISPARLTATLAEGLARDGVTFIREKVLGLVPRDDGFDIWTNLGPRRTDAVLVAAGAWTARLIAPLGVKLPLEAERGYHLLLEASRSVPMPVLHQEKGFGLTPMEEGLRAGGTVEFAGLDAAPRPERSLILQKLAGELLPGLRSRPLRSWMGFRPSLPDSVPAIGPVRPGSRLFVATGHGHFGMIGAPATGRLLAELVTGRPASIDPSPYSPMRFDRRLAVPTPA